MCPCFNGAGGMAGWWGRKKWSDLMKKGNMVQGIPSSIGKRGSEWAVSIFCDSQPQTY